MWLRMLLSKIRALWQTVFGRSCRGTPWTFEAIRTIEETEKLREFVERQREIVLLQYCYAPLPIINGTATEEEFEQLAAEWKQKYQGDSPIITLGGVDRDNRETVEE